MAVAGWGMFILMFGLPANAKHDVVMSEYACRIYVPIWGAHKGVGSKQ